MEAFIEIFNANRHWIMPAALAMLILLLSYEIKSFFSNDQGRRKDEVLSDHSEGGRSRTRVFRLAHNSEAVSPRARGARL